MPDYDHEIILLPEVLPSTTSSVDQLMTAIGVPRDVVATNPQIGRAWSQLPLLLSQIPVQYRDQMVARMCIAIATGLFDAAVSYIWNSSMVVLRQRVRDFGLPVVSQLLSRSLEEGDLLELKDVELLKLCLDINLLSVDAHFFLNQCRDIRNNYSAAHPTTAPLDEFELMNFVSRCVKHAIGSTPNPTGVDSRAFLIALRRGIFSDVQTNEWLARLRATHESQRDSLIGTLHGIYCDPASGEEVRRNCMALCKPLAGEFSPRLNAQLVSRHADYAATGETGRQTASREFFAELRTLSWLAEPERHTLVVGAAQRLLGVHREWNNFHNEPPFAERLYELTSQMAVPESAKPIFVEAVLTCAIGNYYGVSRQAIPFYEKLVRSFSPKEIAILVDAIFRPNSDLQLSHLSSTQRSNLRRTLSWIDPKSVPTSYMTRFHDAAGS